MEEPASLMTVIGPLDGKGLTGSIVADYLFRDTRPSSETTPAETTFKLDMLHQARRRLSHFPHLLRLDSVDDIVFELKKFATRGGELVVDITTQQEGRNPAMLAKASMLSGVPIIMGASVPEDALDSKVVSEKLCHELQIGIEIPPIHHGAEASTESSISLQILGRRVRAGIIGEIRIGDGYVRQDRKRKCRYETIDRPLGSCGINEQNKSVDGDMTKSASKLSRSELISLDGAALAHQRTKAAIMLRVVEVSNNATTFGDEDLDTGVIERDLANEAIEFLVAKGVDPGSIVVAGVEAALLLHASVNSCRRRNSSSSSDSSNSNSCSPLLSFDKVLVLCSGFGAAQVVDSDEPSYRIIASESVAFPYSDDLLLRALAHSQLSDPPLRILLSQFVCSKLQLSRYGGSGYGHVCDEDGSVVARLRCHLMQRGCTNSDDLAEKLSQNRALLPLLTWWRPPKEKDVEPLKSSCSWCGNRFIYDHNEHFSKYAFEYCKAKCLRSHRKAGFVEGVTAATPIASGAKG